MMCHVCKLCKGWLNRNSHTLMTGVFESISHNMIILSSVGVDVSRQEDAEDARGRRAPSLPPASQMPQVPASL